MISLRWTFDEEVGPETIEGEDLCGWVIRGKRLIRGPDGALYTTPQAKQRGWIPTQSSQGLTGTRRWIDPKASLGGGQA